MWEKMHSIVVKDIDPARVWQIWSDVPNRVQWDIDTEWASMEGPFEKGAIFYIKPKGAPKIKMEITGCIPHRQFTDCFRIPFARLYGIHQMEETPEGLRLTTIIKVEGLLGWVLRKLVAEKVASEMAEQTDRVIQLARRQ